jgi:hypothetical protein
MQKDFWKLVLFNNQLKGYGTCLLSSLTHSQIRLFPLVGGCHYNKIGEKKEKNKNLSMRG